MRVTAHLDVEMIAIETEDQVSVMIELAAPPAPGDGAERAPSTLVVVLDRSGSMRGDRLDGAKSALTALVDRLDPRDHFGLVVFDDRADVVVPARRLTDKAAARRAIAGVEARNSTDLSGGYLRGLQEARRVAGAAGATVLIISDGHANAGITDPEALARVAAEAYTHGVTTSTLGFGLGYDERIMSALARGGSGNEHFAEEPDTAIALIAGEVQALLAQTVQAASLHVAVTPVVSGVLVVNDLPANLVDDGLLIELGGFYADETRKLVLTFDVPAVAALGLAEIATLTFTHVELPALAQHTVTVPVHVNVVHGDVAAGRVPDPVVRTELVYLRAQRAKRRASDLLNQGDSTAALEEIRQAREEIGKARADAPESLAADLAEEAATLDYLARETEMGSASRAGKFLSASSRARLQKRGRRYDTPPVPPTEEPDQDEDGNES
ncbi:VWA domain-containing protein [Actinoplanes hulinensis]|uniref:VWA domain-containing protein n=1 Tax=Actinoplanes hulinensis TaxID=1144547 RepID=A0ABS7B0R7_9ACTN|nr:VWA domain-containing protein [Actinoplanes hulinensis]MBW6434457.1 VWA domain-containing protein [Actinoplanes hulinensis]